MPFRNAERTKIPHGPGRRPGGDGVALTGQLFGGEDVTGTLDRRYVAQKFLRYRLVLDRLSVENERVMPKLESVAGQADHALDQTLAVMRQIKDDNVTALRIAPLSNVPGGEGHFKIVGQLVHIDAVAFQNGGFHGTTGHV